MCTGASLRANNTASACSISSELISTRPVHHLFISIGEHGIWKTVGYGCGKHPIGFCKKKRNLQKKGTKVPYLFTSVIKWKENKKITCPAWKSQELSALQCSPCTADCCINDASYSGPASPKQATMPEIASHLWWPFSCKNLFIFGAWKNPLKICNSYASAICTLYAKPMLLYQSPNSVFFSFWFINQQFSSSQERDWNSKINRK